MSANKVYNFSYVCPWGSHYMKDTKTKLNRFKMGLNDVYHKIYIHYADLYFSSSSIPKCWPKLVNPANHRKYVSNGLPHVNQTSNWPNFFDLMYFVFPIKALDDNLLALKWSKICCFVSNLKNFVKWKMTPILLNATYVADIW